MSYKYLTGINKKHDKHTSELLQKKIEAIDSFLLFEIEQVFVLTTGESVFKINDM